MSKASLEIIEFTKIDVILQVLRADLVIVVKSVILKVGEHKKTRTVKCCAGTFLKVRKL